MKGPFSHSRLSSFEDCPKKFHYRYVLKIPSETESIEGFVGKRVHEVLERLYRATDRGHVPSLPKVLERYRVLFEEQYEASRVRIVRSGTDLRFYREYGERCLANYYRHHYPFDGDETLGLEEHVLFSLDGTRSYRIQGFVDRIGRARDGAIEIHDYKTGRRIPTQEQVDADRQLALYQMGVSQSYGARNPIRLVWHYVSRGITRRSTRTPEQLDALRAETTGLIDRIRAERDFEPRTSPLCSWCEYNHVCPAVAGNAAQEATPRPIAASPAPTAAATVERTATPARSRSKRSKDAPDPAQLSLL